MLNILTKSIIAIAGSLTLFAGAATKTYQVTGPVLEITDTSIIVQKGKEKWEIGKDAATKINGDLKVGSKVTIEYTMAAMTVDSKPAKEVKKTK